MAVSRFPGWRSGSSIRTSLLVAGLIYSLSGGQLLVHTALAEYIPPSTGDLSLPMETQVPSPPPPDTEIPLPPDVSLTPPATHGHRIQAKTAQVNLQPGLGHDFIYHLLLRVVYEHDRELNKLTKKLEASRPVLLLAFMAVYGLALSSIIYTRYHLNHGIIAASSEELKRRVEVPVNLNLVSTSIGMSALSLGTAFNGIVGRKISARKKYLSAQVNEVIRRLASGAKDDQVRDLLASLLDNEEASAEFLRLWHNSHPPPQEELAPLNLPSPTQAMQRQRIDFLLEKP
jgi:hypothetical protein